MYPSKLLLVTTTVTLSNLSKKDPLVVGAPMPLGKSPVSNVPKPPRGRDHRGGEFANVAGTHRIRIPDANVVDGKVMRHRAFVSIFCDFIFFVMLHWFCNVLYRGVPKR